MLNRPGRFDGMFKEMDARRTRDAHRAKIRAESKRSNHHQDMVVTGITGLCTLGFIIACAVLTMRGVNHKGWGTQPAFEAWFNNHTCKGVGGSCVRDICESSQCSGNPRCRCCSVVGGCCGIKYADGFRADPISSPCNGIPYWDGLAALNESKSLFLAGMLMIIGVVLCSAPAVFIAFDHFSGSFDDRHTPKYNQYGHEMRG